VLIIGDLPSTADVIHARAAPCQGCLAARNERPSGGLSGRHL